MAGDGVDNLRTCRDCGIVQPVDEFPLMSGKRQQAKGYRTHRCVPCFRKVRAAHKLAWRRANEEKDRAYMRQFRESGKAAEAYKRFYWKDPEARRARMREAYWRDVELSRQRNKMYDARRDTAKRVPQRREAWRKRYYLKVSSGIFTDADWRKMLNRHGGVCAYCKERAAEHREHIIPICRGGRNTVGNILPACAPCNLSKGRLTLMEWRLSGRAPAAIQPTNRRAAA